ncbi:MAG: heme-binding protein [Rhodoluna sp.]|nr:heme-binding protein [Rhodoluna sp.]
MAIEKPEYRVLSSANGIELREYQEHWLAECNVENIDDLRTASSAAFNRLFNYISGQNEPGQKIAMTSPVQQTKSETGWRVSFVVPSSFKPEEIPIPLHSSITLKKVVAGKFAAIRYRGAWNNDVFEAKTRELMSALKALKLKPIGDVSSAVYNPPFTPPPLRRNEVLVRIG